MKQKEKIWKQAFNEERWKRRKTFSIHFALRSMYCNTVAEVSSHQPQSSSLTTLRDHAIWSVCST